MANPIQVYVDLDGNNQSLTDWVGAGGGGLSINNEDLTANKTINEGDPSVQLLNPTTADREVLLPQTIGGAAPVFFIVNNSSGMFALNIKTSPTSGIVYTLSDFAGQMSVRVAYLGSGTNYLFF